MWKTKGKQAMVTCLGVREGGRMMSEQGDIGRGEVVRAIKNLKCGKASRIDGITAEIWKAFCN